MKKQFITLLSFLMVFQSIPSLYAGDVEVMLTTANGSSEFEVLDSGSTVVFEIDSDGNFNWPIALGNNISNLTLPSTGANPNGVITAAEGTIAFDTVNNIMYVNTDGATAWSSVATGTGSNIYTTNDSLTGNRTVTMAGNSLTFDGTGDVAISDAGEITVTPGQGLDTNAAGALDIAQATATSVNIGSGVNTALTVTTDGTGTAEVVLPNDSIDTNEILDNTITATDLSATLTFADADIIDLSAIDSSGVAEGLILPQANDVSAATAEGQISWDADGDTLIVGTGGGQVTLGTGTGDVIDVGNCSGPACFTGVSGNTLTSTTSEIIDLSADAIFEFQRNDAGAVTFLGADDAGAADTIYDTTGAGAITVGSADVTAITLTTDGTGTAEVVLPNDSVDTNEILDNTITATDLAATVTLADSDLFDFSNINASSTTEGLILPQDNDVSAATAEGQISWDADGDQLVVGTGGGQVTLGTGTGDVTDVGDCNGPACFDGTEGDVLTSTSGETIDFGTTDGTFELARNTNATVTLLANDTGGDTDFLIDTTGAGSITVGSADVTALTVTTDGTGTAEVVLPNDSIDTNEILDNTITATDLAATVTLADSDLFDFSSINASSTTEGLILPQDNDVSAATAEGQISWDADGNQLVIGTGGGQITVGAPTLDAAYEGGQSMDVDAGDVAINIGVAGNSLLIDNDTAALTVDDGLEFASSGAGGVITDAIDAADADIVNAINIGANNIAGTNFDVNGGTGEITVAVGQGLDTNAAGALDIAQATATSVNIGSGVNTALTVTTDGTGTAEVVLPNDSIDTNEILDNTITATDLSATLTFADADIINLSAVDASSTTEGLILPQANDVSAATAEGQISWDADGDSLVVGTGGGQVVLGTGTGDVTDVGDCNGPACFTGAEGDVLTSTSGETIDFGTTDGTFELARNTNATVTLLANDTGGDTDFLIDTTGAGAITVGSADVTALTVTTDGTGDAELVLPTDSVSGTEIADDTIDFTELSDTMSVDAATSVALGANSLTFGAAGAGDFVVTDGTDNYLRIDPAVDVATAEIELGNANDNPDLLFLGTGNVSFETASTFNIPAADAFTFTADGQMGLDTNISAELNDLLQYQGGQSSTIGGASQTYNVISVSNANLPGGGVDDGKVLAYNNANDNFEFISAASGDVTDVGNCSGPACFTGASGNTLTSTTSDVIDLATDAVFEFQRDDAGAVTFLGADDAGAADTIYDTTGAGAITVGSADVTAITLTTDGTGTAEVVLPNDSIDTNEILDNTITATDLSATLTFADADIINLSAVDASSTTEGLILPQANDVSAATAEGQISWDADGDSLVVGTGGGQVVLGTGTGDVTDVGDCNGPTCFDGTEGDVLTSTSGETIDFGTTDGTFELARNTNATVTLLANDTGGDTDFLIDTTGAGAITVGSADVTALTVTTDGTGTAEVVLPNDSIDTNEILDNTITATDLSATLTFADADIINLSAVDASSTTEGLILPQANDVSAATAEGQISWDADGDSLVVGTGGGQVVLGTGTGDVTDVGDCNGPACFTGAEGDVLTSTSGETIDFGTTDGTFELARNTNATVTLLANDTGGDTDFLIDTTGAGAITVGSADVTALTVTTDGTGTAEVVLPNDSIDTNEILDNTITATDLAATVTLADSDLFDFSSINASSTTEGLILPQDNDVSAATAEGQISWDADGNQLVIGTGGGQITVGAPTLDAAYEGGQSMDVDAGDVAINIGVAGNSLLIDNDTAALTVDDGLEFASSGAGGVITDAIDAADADIVNAINIGANNIEGTNFDVNGGTGEITVAVGQGLDTNAAGALDIAQATATSVNIGSGANTALTVTTDGTGTAEVVLPNDSIDTNEILDNTITATDLSATLTFADADIINLSAVDASSTTEGLILPQANDVSAATAEGQISWDADGDSLVVGTGGGQVVLGTGTGDVTDVGDCNGPTCFDGTEGDVLTSTSGETFDFGTTDGTFELARNTNATVTLLANDTGGDTDFLIDTTGAGAITVGSADVTALTVTTDGTGDAELVLPTDSVSGTEIADDTIDFTELSDTMSVDAATSVALGANSLTFGAAGAGDFVVTDGTDNYLRIDPAVDVATAEIELGNANDNPDLLFLGTGNVSFETASTFNIPAADAFTFTADGQMGLDTNISAELNDLLQYQGGQSSTIGGASQTYNVISVSNANLPGGGVDDGKVLAYNNTNDNFEFVSPTSAVALSAVTAGVATNTIDSTNFAQTWNWSTADTENPMTMNFNALTTGDGLTLASSSTGLTTNGSLATISLTGNNAANIGDVLKLESTGADSDPVVLNVENAGDGDSMRIVSTGATSRAIAVESSTQNNQVVNVVANSLTSGSAVNVTSSSADATARALVQVTNTGNAAATPVSISQQSNGTGLNIDLTTATTASAADIDANAVNTGNVLDISGTALTTGSLINLTAGAAVDSDNGGAVIKIEADPNDSFIQFNDGTNTPGIFTGTTNPSGGLIAREGSLFIDSSTGDGELWLKTGAASTAWTEIPTSGTSEWTDTGTVVHPNESDDAVVVGGTTAGNSDIALGADGSATFNVQGAAVDFVVQGDTDANLLTVDGSADFVGIGTSTPSSTFDVDGVVSFTTATEASVTSFDVTNGVMIVTGSGSLANITSGVDGTLLRLVGGAGAALALNSTGNLGLDRDIPFTIGPGDTIDFVFVGTVWQEVSRTNN